MTVYSRDRHNYNLTVIANDDGTFTAILTNRTTGKTLTNAGWMFRDLAINYVQRMYASRLI